VGLQDSSIQRVRAEKSQTDKTRQRQDKQDKTRQDKDKTRQDKTKTRQTTEAGLTAFLKAFRQMRGGTTDREQIERADRGR
jgi:Flp pilus assembly protein TadB